jgi:poly-gamma-glutamate capsule biosynthesis protein CapA/YwtB (metallophosphatase superfamily)
MKTSSSLIRTAVLRCAAVSIFLLPATFLFSAPAGGPEITLLAGGDLAKGDAVRGRDIGQEPVYTGKPGNWIAIPYLNLEEHREAIQAAIGKKDLDEGTHYGETMIPPARKFATAEDERRYPFLRIVDLVRNADVAFANLEMPLTDARCIARGACGAPAFANTLHWAGMDVVSVANNRVDDAETIGMLDTIHALSNAGVSPVGGGHNLDEARRPLIVERKGLKLAFLAYTYGTSLGINGFVERDQPGVMPLDPLLIKEDIKRVRSQVDFVVLSFHWGKVVQRDAKTGAWRFKEVVKEERKFAQEMIDAGADIILGAHPHVPKGVEVYKSGVIFYCPGIFIFGHGHDDWTDNFMERLTLTRGAIPRVEILPIAGKGLDVLQPFQLEGQRAQALLQDIQKLSADLDTNMTIEGDIGVIRPQASQVTQAPGK